MSYTSEGLIQLGFEWEKDFCIYEDYGLVWKSDQPQPTEAECEVAKAEYDALQYQRDRKAEYPSIEECVHAILDDDLDALQAKRAEVKARYPKP
jgi:hypothetical protein